MIKNIEAEANLPKLISPKDIKKYLGCDDRKVYAIIKERDFPSMRIGRLWYIDKAKFIDWMDRQTKKRK